MRNFLRIIGSTCILFAIISFSFTSANAAEQLTINNETTVNVGDKITFTLNLADTEEDIIGFELRLFYDSESLELVDNSLTYPKFDNVVSNTQKKDVIPMNWTNIFDPISFRKKAVFLSVEFNVIKGGDAEISYFVTDIYGKDMTYLKSYTWTYDISVNNQNVLTDAVPVVNQSQEHKQGSYINYIDGKGENNSPNAEHHEAETGTSNPKADSVVNRVGETYNYYENDVIEATKFVANTNNGSENSGPPVILFVLIGSVVAIGLIAGAILLTKKNK